MTKGINCSDQVARSPDYTRPLVKLALIPWVLPDRPPCKNTPI